MSALRHSQRLSSRWRLPSNWFAECLSVRDAKPRVCAVQHRQRVRGLLSMNPAVFLCFVMVGDRQTRWKTANRSLTVGAAICWCSTRALAASGRRTTCVKRGDDDARRFASVPTSSTVAKSTSCQKARARGNNLPLRGHPNEKQFASATFHPALRPAGEAPDAPVPCRWRSGRVTRSSCFFKVDSSCFMTKK